MLEKHLRETDEQIGHLQGFRRELAHTLDDWKRSGDKGIPGDVICGLIERSIPGTSRKNGSRSEARAKKAREKT